jgi:Holliday junction resolvase RusA-like endonuclease
LAPAFPRPRASLRVAGAPAPKGSRTQFANGGSRESSKRCKPWVEQIAYAARANRPGGVTLDPPYSVELTFYMPEGKRPRYPWPTKDGDLDKLVRAVLDGLTQGGLIVDDRHVTRIVTTKLFGTPGVSVVIS